jgi:hypothetical protein
VGDRLLVDLAVAPLDGSAIRAYRPEMLKELEARSVSFDVGTDSTVVELAGAPKHPVFRDTAGTLLLDDEGRLAGIDLRGPSGSGWVVMLRPHEDVARTEPGRSVRVAVGDDERPTVVRIPGARPRGAEMSIL